MNGASVVTPGDWLISHYTCWLRVITAQPHCTTLQNPKHYITSLHHCTALHCSALHCTALHCTGLLHCTNTIHYCSVLLHCTNTLNYYTALLHCRLLLHCSVVISAQCVSLHAPHIVWSPTETAHFWQLDILTMVWWFQFEFSCSSYLAVLDCSSVGSFNLQIDYQFWCTSLNLKW